MESMNNPRWIYRVVAVLALLLVFVAVANAQSVITVTNDPGGRVSKFAGKISHMQEIGTLVRIDGPCLSACTMVAALDNVCVTQRASLGFHMPYRINPITRQLDMSYEAERASEALGMAMWLDLPDSLRALAPIWDWPGVYRGQSTNALLIVTGQALIDALGECE